MKYNPFFIRVYGQTNSKYKNICNKQERNMRLKTPFAIKN